MSTIYGPRAGLLVGITMLALAAPAGAATAEWQVGPLSLDAGKAAQVGVEDPCIFPCLIGVRVLAGPAGRVATGVSTAKMAVLLDTISNPDILPAGGVQTATVQDPTIKPGQRRLVMAMVQAQCT